MKKLTAGIFSVLMGLVSVNAAEAAVASKGYVDAKIGETDGKTVVEMINSVDGDATALAGRVTTVEGAIETLNGDEKVAGSVAKKIADAIIAEDLTEKFAGKQDVANLTNDIDNDIESDDKYPSAKAVASFVDAQIADVTGGVGTQISDLETLIEVNTKAIADETAARQDADTALEKELQTYADQAESDAVVTAGDNADAKISNLNLSALSRIPVECQSEDSFCVLTAKAGMFYWEAIERADDEEQPEGTPIPAVNTAVAQ